MKMMITTLAATLAFATASTAATFTEADFGGDVTMDIFSPASVGVLGAGETTFSGSVTCADKFAVGIIDSPDTAFLCGVFSDVVDVWAFDLASGFTLTSVDVEVSRLGGVGGDVRFNVFDTDFSILGGGRLDGSGAVGATLFSGRTGPGSGYRIEALASGGFSDPDPFSFSYRLTVTVQGPPDTIAPIPLPASGLLLLGGLGGLVAAGRRRRR
jgi:hypothetical protein